MKDNFNLYLDKSEPKQLVIEWYNMHFKCNENKINNWEAVYKNLIFKAIHRIGGKWAGRCWWLRDQVRWGRHVPLRDKKGGGQEWFTWLNGDGPDIYGRPAKRSQWLGVKGVLGCRERQNFRDNLAKDGFQSDKNIPYIKIETEYRCSETEYSLTTWGARLKNVGPSAVKGYCGGTISKGILE